MAAIKFIIKIYQVIADKILFSLFNSKGLKRSGDYKIGRRKKPGPKERVG